MDCGPVMLACALVRTCWRNTQRFFTYSSRSSKSSSDSTPGSALSSSSHGRSASLWLLSASMARATSNNHGETSTCERLFRCKNGCGENQIEGPGCRTCRRSTMLQSREKGRGDAGDPHPSQELLSVSSLLLGASLPVTDATALSSLCISTSWEDSARTASARTHETTHKRCTTTALK